MMYTAQCSVYTLNSVNVCKILKYILEALFSFLQSIRELLFNPVPPWDPPWCRRGPLLTIFTLFWYSYKILIRNPAGILIPRPPLPATWLSRDQEPDQTGNKGEVCSILSSSFIQYTVLYGRSLFSCWSSIVFIRLTFFRDGYYLGKKQMKTN